MAGSVDEKYVLWRLVDDIFGLLSFSWRFELWSET